MSHTRQLADYVASTKYEDLPEATRTASKRVLLDYIGVVLAATQYGPGKTMNEYVRDQGGNGHATVLGTDIITSPSQAAFANGTMAADMEQDDVHPESNLHASSVFGPAVMAVAENLDVTGSELLNSLVVSYDVGCRLSIAMDNSLQYSEGFHPTAVSGIFGAAAGVARLLKLDGDNTDSAIGIAGTQAAGLLTWEMEAEHYTKSIQSGVPARNAVVAGELAARGYVGARNTLAGEYNVFDAFSTRDNFDRLLEGLGERYEIEYTGFKFYSVCRNIHSTLDQLLDLSNEQHFGAGDVEKLDVWLPHTQVPIVDNNVLTTHNLQYAVAVALSDRVVERAQTAPERKGDPVLNEIASRVTLRGHDELEALYPTHWPSRVELRLKDGREFNGERLDPRGTTFVPVTQADIEAKFTGMASQVLPADRVAAIIEVINRLDELDSVRELTTLLRK